MTQKQLLAVSITTGFLYLVVNYFRGENGGYFFTSALIVWMVIYFILAYIKKYLVNMSKNVRLNLGIVLFSGTCSLLLFLFTNFAGMRMEIFNGKLQLWNNNCSPLLIMLVIGLLNLARSADIKINIINGIAALSMYVYVIHENILLRIYIRPAVWQHIYEKHGYQYILGWAVLLTGGILIFAIAVSFVYKETLYKWVRKINEKHLYPILARTYRCIERIALKLN